MEFGNRSEGDEVSGGGLISKLQTLNLKEEEDIQRRDAFGAATLVGRVGRRFASLRFFR